MKYLKILGLAAVAAAALMAFLGAGTASAQLGERSALCKVTPTNGICTVANTWPVGTEIHAVLEEGNAILTAGEASDECKKSTVKGKVEKETTPEGKIESLTFEECTLTTEVLENGKLTVHHDPQLNGTHNGLLTAEGVRVRVKAFFGILSCDYGGTVTEGLTVTGGPEATIDATAPIKLLNQTGSAECPDPAIWHAKYKVTSPTPLFVGTHE